MQTRSYQKTPTQQDLFGIDAAPAKVRQHGLVEAHTWPLVSKGKQGGAHAGAFRVSAFEAWGFPEIELRAGNSWPCIILDVDGANALYRIVEAVEKAEILTPNWTVTRKGSGGTHAVWNLARPVHRGEQARIAPLKALSRVSEFYADTLRADSGYVGILSHNPMAQAHGPGFVTNWLHKDSYSLPQLAKIIPLGWRRPVVCKTAIGRNCDLFQSLIRWAGCPENRENDCLAAAHVINQSFELPLPDSEVAGIAASVERYRKNWSYYTAEQKTLWGRERGVKSGASRRKLTADRDRAIVQAVESGRSLRDVGGEYGIDHKAVSWIVNRGGWGMNYTDGVLKLEVECPNS